MSNEPQTDPRAGVVSTALLGSVFLPDKTLLDKCVISEDARAKFKAEANQCCRRDDETGAIVVAYVHPDGRVLIDAIRLPNNEV